MRKIGVAVIGLGFAGSNLHLVSYLENKNCKIKAICDVNRNYSKKFPPTLFGEFTTDYREILGRVDVDAVSIATPPKFHYLITLDALKAGKHVLCEKPFVMTLSQAKDIMVAEKKYGKHVMVGLTFRYLKPFFEFKKILSDNKNPLISIRCTEFELLLKNHKWDKWEDWQFNPAMSPGAALSESGTHLIDRMRWLLGSEVRKVYATTSGYENNHKKDHSAFVILHFANGVIGEISLSYQVFSQYQNDKALCLTEIFGNDFYACVNYQDYFKSNPSITLYDNYQWKNLKLDVDPKNPAQHEIDAFIQSIIQNKKPPITSYDGYKNLEVLLAAYKSSKTGKPVTLNE